MKSIDFLSQELIKLHDVCPYLNIKYEYRDYLNTHIIEIMPVKNFNSDKEYIDEQIKLEDEFENLFSNEEILFVTENQLISVRNPIMDLKVVSVAVEDLQVNYKEFHYEEMHFDDLIVEDCNYDSFKYSKITDIDFFDIKTEINNRITIKGPPPKRWWSSKNKQSSNSELEFFFN